MTAKYSTTRASAYQKPAANVLTKEITSRNSSSFSLEFYFMRHVQACLHSLGLMMRAPFITVMVLTVIGIVLALPTTLFTLLHNAQQLVQTWNDNSQISVYLRQDIAPDQITILLRELKQKPEIAQANYISPDQGLEELEQQGDFKQAISALNSNPLPGVIIITPSANLNTPATIEQLTADLKQYPEVQSVQVNLEWIKRLYEIIQLGKRISMALACLLALGILLIISNTIYLATQNHRKEIEVCKLVGATDAFIRRPFLYTGILYGLFGGIITWIIVTVIMAWLSVPAETLAKLYNSVFKLQWLSFSDTLMLLLMSMLLGWLGSWLAVSRQLRAYH